MDGKMLPHTEGGLRSRSKERKRARVQGRSALLRAREIGRTRGRGQGSGHYVLWVIDVLWMSVSVYSQPRVVSSGERISADTIISQ